MEIANGREQDGITFRCHLEPPNWVVTVTHPDGRQLQEQFRWSFEPTAGPDIRDVYQAEEIMERFVKELRQ